MHSLTLLLIALIGGLIPSSIWLAFWLREDRERPEPKLHIAISFLAGMLSVIVVIFLEKIISGQGHIGGWTIAAWAFFEESIKFMAADIVGLHSKTADEPVDMMIYLIVAALGFAAMENALFLIAPVASGSLLAAAGTMLSRFVGTTLIHTLGSAAIGLCLGVAFYQKKIVRSIAVLAGISIATLLHAAFNLFIIGGNAIKTAATFAVMWMMIVVLMKAFKKVKAVKNETITL